MKRYLPLEDELEPELFAEELLEPDLLELFAELLELFAAELDLAELDFTAELDFAADGARSGPITPGVDRTVLAPCRGWKYALPTSGFAGAVMRGGSGVRVTGGLRSTGECEPEPREPQLCVPWSPS